MVGWSYQDSSLIKRREEKEKEVRDKLIKIHKNHSKSTFMKLRLEILKRLIQRNKQNQIITVKKLDLSKQGHILSMQHFLNQETTLKPLNKKSSFCKGSNSLPSSQQNASQTESSRQDLGKVYLPLYFFKVKNSDINFETSTTLEESQLKLYSKDPISHCLFEDFEIIKRLV